MANDMIFSWYKFFFTFFIYFYLSFILVYGFEFQSSILMNFELEETTKSFSPGYDINVFFNGIVGLRYTYFQEQVFEDGSSYEHDSGKLSIYSVTAEYKSFQILKTLDYKKFDVISKGPFDWVTAYAGIGYAELTGKLKDVQYTSSSGSNLIKKTFENDITFAVNTVTFGFIAQEKFLLIDSRVLYYFGDIEEQDDLKQKLTFSKYLLIFAIGIGF